MVVSNGAMSLIELERVVVRCRCEGRTVVMDTENDALGAAGYRPAPAGPALDLFRSLF